MLANDFFTLSLLQQNVLWSTVTKSFDLKQNNRVQKGNAVLFFPLIVLIVSIFWGTKQFGHPDITRKCSAMLSIFIYNSMCQAPLEHMLL